MDKFYAVYNTGTREFVTGLMGKSFAKAEASRLNLAMKPQFQNYTVITVIFDPEV